MFFRLLLLFTIVPITDLYLLLKLGEIIGAYYTVIIILGTGFAGVYLAKSQGFAVINKYREQLGSGQMPGDQLLEGVMILVGALFLLTPGLLTDTTGFLFLLPVTRRPIREFIKKKLRKALSNGSVNISFKKF